MWQKLHQAFNCWKYSIKTTIKFKNGCDKSSKFQRFLNNCFWIISLLHKYFIVFNKIVFFTSEEFLADYNDFNTRNVLSPNKDMITEDIGRYGLGMFQ